MSIPESGVPEGQGACCSYLVVIEGDPDCDHVLYYHGVSSRGGVAFAEYECGKCGRAIAEPTGGAEPPDTP